MWGLLVAAPGESLAQTQAVPSASSGVIDLSGWDFKRDGSVPLTGEWSFWWNELVAPESFLDGAEWPRAHGLFDVPSYWNGRPSPTGAGEPMEGAGHGTFALRVSLPAGHDELSIDLEEINVSVGLYVVTGDRVQRVFGSGTVGAGTDEEIPQLRFNIGDLRIGDATSVTLVWHMSNYRHPRGGPSNPPRVGLVTVLHEDVLGSRLRAVGVISVLFIMMLYHFALVWQRPEDRGSYWFALVCLLLGLRQIFTSRLMEVFASSASATQFEWAVAGEYLTMCLGTACFVTFMLDLVYARWFARVVTGVWVVSLGYSALAIVTPATVYPDYLTYWQVVMLAAIVLTFVHLGRRAIMRKNPIAIASLVGFAAVAAGVVNDVLKAQGVLYTPYLAVYGLGIFVFIKSYILAARFSVAFRTAERLTKHLQKEVEERTEHLAVRNKAFADILDNIDLALFTIDRDGVISPEYSLVTEQLYVRSNVAGKAFVDVLLLPGDPEREVWDTWIRGAFDCGEQWEDYLKKVPASTLSYNFVNREGKTTRKILELTFQPMTPHDSDEVTRLMIITTDITSMAALKREVEERERDLEESIGQITKILDEDPEMFECFLEEAEELLASLEVDLIALRRKPKERAAMSEKIGRDLHTLKGTAAFYNQARLAESTHVTEEHFKELMSHVGELPDEGIDRVLEGIDILREHATRARDVYDKIMHERSGNAADTEGIAIMPTFVKVNSKILDGLQSLTGKILGAVGGTDLDTLRREVEQHWFRLRKTPAQKLLDRFPRMVRDLARHLDKQVHFESTGGEIAIDRSLFDALEGILVHMVRNAVDHGIDTPDERASASKDPDGLIHLKLAEVPDGLQVVLEDDGRGINPDIVKERAVQKGLISDSEAAQMSRDAAMMLLFRPGFSTAAHVTDISGRGVGMDAVQTMVVDLGGQIHIASEVGKGTTFTLSFPTAKPGA